jgi:hypothetical protein
MQASDAPSHQDHVGYLRLRAGWCGGSGRCGTAGCYPDESYAACESFAFPETEGIDIVRR